MNSRTIDWRRLERGRFHLVGERLAQPYLAEIKQANTERWHRSRSWMLGLYFGVGDSRLWVPRRRWDGTAHPSVRVINFSHPLGRKALPVLLLGYLVGFLIVATLTAFAIGIRW